MPQRENNKTPKLLNLELYSGEPIKYCGTRTGQPYFGKAVLSFMNTINMTVKSIVDYEIALNHHLATNDDRIDSKDLSYILVKGFSEEISTPIKYIMLGTRIPYLLVNPVKDEIAMIYKKAYHAQKEEWVKENIDVSTIRRFEEILR